jgi:hypothetical protein
VATVFIVIVAPLAMIVLPVPPMSPPLHANVEVATSVPLPPTVPLERATSAADAAPLKFATAPLNLIDLALKVEASVAPPLAKTTCPVESTFPRLVTLPSKMRPAAPVMSDAAVRLCTPPKRRMPNERSKSRGTTRSPTR